MANGIREGWPGWVLLLTTINSNRDEWLDSTLWLALATGIQDGWSGWVLWLVTATKMDHRVCILWLATTNGIQDWWPGFNIMISYG